jgi:hypothetical protein
VKRIWPTLSYFAPLVLVGCISTALNPKVIASPGPNKSPQAFAADEVACKQYADNQINEARNETLAPLIEAMRQEDEGGPMVPDSAVTSAIATLQAPYDMEYFRCMFSKGNLVPGYQPAVAAPERPRRRVHRPRPARTTAPNAAGSQAPATEFIEPAPSQ